MFQHHPDIYYHLGIAGSMRIKIHNDLYRPMATITFNAIIQKSRDNKLQNGWSYVIIPEAVVKKLTPKSRASFRIKGTIDEHVIRQVALLPLKGGGFMLPINAAMRKATGKKEGDKIKIAIQPDYREIKLEKEFLVCLADDAKAQENFNKLTPGHQRYFSKWIESAKTIETKTKRISQSVQGIGMGFNYGEMIRYFKEKKSE